MRQGNAHAIRRFDAPSVAEEIDAAIDAAGLSYKEYLRVRARAWAILTKTLAAGGLWDVAICTAAATLPMRVCLADGRMLVQRTAIPNGVGYAGEDGMIVLARYTPTPHGARLHVSASYADYAPSWRDMALVRAALFPADIDVIQRGGERGSSHPYCLHLWAVQWGWQDNR